LPCSASFEAAPEACSLISSRFEGLAGGQGWDCGVAELVQAERDRCKCKESKARVGVKLM